MLLEQELHSHDGQTVKLVKARLYSRTIEFALYFIFALFLLYRYFRQRREMKKPLTVVFQLVFLMLSGLLDTIRNIWLISLGQYEMASSDNKWIQILGDISSALFLMQHWEFASQYLKVATLFELAFSENTESIGKRRKKRKRILQIIRIVAYTFFTTTTLILILIPIGKSFIPIRTFWTVSTILVTCILVFSMLRIRRLKKILLGSEVFQSEKLMRVHLFGFIIVSLLSIVGVSLAIKMVSDQKHGNEQTEKFTHIDITKIVIDTCTNFVWFLIVITMFLMYLRYSAPITRNQSNFIRQRFLLVFNANEDAMSAVEDQRVQTELIRREEKRNRIYREMTDQQIDEVIRTMMSISNVHESLDMKKLSNKISLNIQDSEIDQVDGNEINLANGE